MKYGTGWRKQRLDYRDKIYRHQISEFERIDENIGYDLRQFPAMNFPIADQRQTGSCVANAVGRNIQYLLRFQGVSDFIPSRMFIYWNARKVIGLEAQDSGCEIRDAFNVISNLGVPPESEWPFQEALIPLQPSKKSFEEAAKHIALIRQSVPQKMQHLLSCLKHRLPIVFGTSVFESWSHVPTSGDVPMPLPGDQPEGMHSVTIVGWNPSQKRFVFANSWGSDWGNEGYGTLPADYILDPDLSADFWSAFLMSKTQEEINRKET